MPSSAPITLTLAHSPDPDDVFMWWPVTGMIDPRDHERVVSPPELDTGGVRFKALPADIAVLNRRAIEVGDLDITALSIFAWAHVRERYGLTSFGASMGHGYGPRVVARAGGNTDVRAAGALFAVPGRKTTAFLLLSMILGEEFAFVEMPFDQIAEAVRTGRGGVTHGVLIHQSQLTIAEQGLVLCLDEGAWWLDRTGLPLPLGGNAVRRDLDARYGAGFLQRTVKLLSSAVNYALKHRERSLEYAMSFAPELTREQAEKYIQMYVSGLTVNAGEVGRRAIEELLAQGAARGFCPVAVGERVEFV